MKRSGHDTINEQIEAHVDDNDFSLLIADEEFSEWGHKFFHLTDDDMEHLVTFWINLLPDNQERAKRLAAILLSIQPDEEDYATMEENHSQD